MSIGRSFIIGGAFYLLLVGFCLDANATPPSQAYDYGVNCGYWYTFFDAAGYSDEIYWGLSPYHPHGYHELLSGEWGAAIYYNGILSEPNAMWLTNRFICPNWDPTNSNFVFDSWPEKWAWDNPNNPVEGYDTGRSVIKKILKNFCNSLEVLHIIITQNMV